MNSTFFTAAILACLAQCALMAPAETTVAASTTQAPAHFINDTKLSKLEETVSELTFDVIKVGISFEQNAALGNTIELTQLLDTIKRLKSKLQLAEVDVQLEITSRINSLGAYGRRLILESLRIQLESERRYLTTIGQTILGSIDDLNQFPNYQSSETIGIAIQLLNSQLTAIMHDISEIDTLIADEQQGNPLNGQISQGTKQKVDQDLQRIEQAATSVKSQVATEFYNEIERLRLENKELNLKQRFDAEFFIDLFNFLVAYTRKFEELFNRLNN